MRKCFDLCDFFAQNLSRSLIRQTNLITKNKTLRTYLFTHLIETEIFYIFRLKKKHAYIPTPPTKVLVDQNYIRKFGQAISESEAQRLGARYEKGTSKRTFGVLF